MKRIFSALLALAIALSLAAAVAPVRAAGGKLVAITFDDGPGPYTNRLLDGLAQRGVKATFFMVGSNVARYPDTVARMYREGHQLANHSYDHSDFTGLSDSGVRSQISKTNDLLSKAAGKGSVYMVRAPYGSTNARVRSLVGAPLVYWSVDPQDWKYRNATTVKNAVVNNAHDGAIILLHDIHSTSVDGALAAIDVLQDKGYEFVTVAELFRRRGVTPENGESYSRCKPNGTDLGPVTSPSISSRAVDGKLEITLTAQPGVEIYYSLDNGNLNQESKRYTGPFTVSTPCTVWAVAAFNMNGSRSATVQETFTKPTAQAPTIQVTDGLLTLQTETTGANLYYTLDGTMAGLDSAVYTGPVALTPGTVITACAGGGEYLTSSQVQAVYSHLGNFFRDVFPGQWYYPDVDAAAAAGYMNGVGDGVFSPNKPVTRGQLVTLLYRFSGADPAAFGESPVADVKPTAYYAEAVAWAYAAGIVNGYENGKFLPDRPISRQELCKVFSAYLSSLGVEIAAAPGAADKYTDCGSISPWALPYVEAMTGLGLVQGDTTGVFRPAGTATRAQAAAMLNRLAALLESQDGLEPAEPEPTEPEPVQPTAPESTSTISN